MSVVLINIFEVPAGDEEAFITAWEKTRNYLMKLPAHIHTAFGSEGFREAAADLRWPFSPALYQVVSAG